MYQPKHLGEFKAFKLPSETYPVYSRVTLRKICSGIIIWVRHPLTQTAVARICGSNAVVSLRLRMYFKPISTKSLSVPETAAVTMLNWKVFENSRKTCCSNLALIFSSITLAMARTFFHTTPATEGKKSSFWYQSSPACSPLSGRFLQISRGRI